MRKFMAGMAVLTLVAVFSISAQRIFCEEKPPVIFSSGFEEEFTNLPNVTHSKADPAAGFMRDNYGNNITRFSRETNNVHTGLSCLKMDCLWYNSGAAAALSSRFPIQKDKEYTLRIWMKADSLPADRSIFLCVRTSAVQDIQPIPGQPAPTKWGPHAYRRCSVSKDWQEFELNIKAKYDCNAEIQVGFESLGTLWLDDISVSEGAEGTVKYAQLPGQWLPPIPAKEPPRKGNLVYNGSFEVGNSGWGKLDWEPLGKSFAGRHIRCTVEKTDTPCGQSALRVDSTEWIESEAIKIHPGQQITLSAYLRAEKEPVDVSFSFFDGTMVFYDRFFSLGTNCRLTDKWQRFTVSGRLPASARNGIYIRIWGGPVFWVDGVQVEEGDLTPFAPQGEVELGTEKIGSTSGIYHPGEKSKVRVFASGQPGAKIKVENTLEDYYGHSRQVLKSEIRLDEQGCGQADLSIKLPAPGIYRLISAAPGTARPAELILAQVKKSSASYGGIQQISMDKLTFDFIKDTGFGWYRGLDGFNPVRWETAEPEKGKFVYDDETVDLILSLGVKILGCLYGAPQWALGRDARDPLSITTDHHGTFNIEDWKNFVREMVRHYKGKINHWEIWNEPSPTESYFKLSKATYTAIKEEDPNAFVVGGGGSTCQAEAPIEKLFSLGLLDYMDAYSFHGYLSIDGREPWDFGRGFKELMKKHGKVVPFWDTEWGISCRTFRRINYIGEQGWERYPTNPYRRSANLIAKHEISERAIGVEANQWYNLNRYEPNRNNEGSLTTLTEYDGSPRASLVALANANDLLGGTELVEMFAPGSIVRLYTFKHPKGALFVVDTKLPEGTSGQLSLPVNLSAELINVMGEAVRIKPKNKSISIALTDEPVFILFKGAKPAEIAGAAREAKLSGLLPGDLVKYLVADYRNQAPEILKGAAYEKEVTLGFEISGWLFTKEDKKLLVFAGTGPANQLHLVSISDPGIKIFNSLSEEMAVEKGRLTIINGAPYIAVGENPEKGITDLGPLQ